MGDADTSTPIEVATTPDESSEPSKKLKLNGDGESERNTGESKGNEEEKAEPVINNNSPEVPLSIVYNKKILQISISLDSTVLELKQRVQKHTGVDPTLQKVLLKGIAKDDAVLKTLGVNENTKKILVIGSSIQDVLSVKEVPSENAATEQKKQEAAAAGNWCSLTQHKKVIDKGLPDDVMPGILAEHDPLPPFPLHGMYSSKGSKVRLTFKLENDELWIGTKERTEKVPISTIRNVVSQPITGYEHYHVIAIQLGPTEASRFFVYWVPAQYVEAIKDALTGA
ncbi:unnamed protein product [Orchesella dallaii]|uniref:Ubiquitin-like domain-containing protein n=1 Tax=Orchesella dallaii TaxID=48710 RepID=A0ABP1R9X7_9HEXA